MHRFTRLAGLAAALAFVGATQAQAHAHLVSTTPAEKTTVASPTAITLRFNEKLEPKFSGFEVTDPRNVVVKLKTSVAQDGVSLVGAPAKALSPGAYKVIWHAVAGDGHRMEGTYSFTVR